MLYHVLNGDALAHKFPAKQLGAELIIVRECLIEGNVLGDTLAEFWRSRAGFIQERYGAPEAEYYGKVVTEFEKLMQVPAGSEANFWFEHDLFCQLNLWFSLSLLADSANKLELYVVYPCIKQSTDLWKGFGPAGPAKLEEAYRYKHRLQPEDIALAANLWKAYQAGDSEQLKRLSQQASTTFPYLKEVCQAQIERFPGIYPKGRVHHALKEILKSDPLALFPEVFMEFSKQEGVYGFGDTQVLPVYEAIKKETI